MKRSAKIDFFHQIAVPLKNLTLFNKLPDSFQYENKNDIIILMKTINK